MSGRGLGIFACVLALVAAGVALVVVLGGREPEPPIDGGGGRDRSGRAGESPKKRVETPVQHARDAREYAGPTLTGSVWSDSGRALVGARVVVRRAGSPASSREFQTGAEGRFVVPVSGGEELELEVAADGHLGSKLRVQGPGELGRLTLLALGAWAVRVEEVDGRPVEGARLTLAGVEGASERALGRTDARGECPVQVPRHAASRVVVESEGHLATTVRWPQPERRVVVVLRPCLRIRGHVRDTAGRPVPQALVATGGRKTRSDAGGSFVLEVHREGRHVLEISKPGFASTEILADAVRKEPYVVTLTATGQIVGTFPETGFRASWRAEVQPGVLGRWWPGHVEGRRLTIRDAPAGRHVTVAVRRGDLRWAFSVVAPQVGEVLDLGELRPPALHRIWVTFESGAQRAVRIDYECEPDEPQAGDRSLRSVRVAGTIRLDFVGEGARVPLVKLPDGLVRLGVTTSGGKARWEGRISGDRVVTLAIRGSVAVTGRIVATGAAPIAELVVQASGPGGRSWAPRTEVRGFEGRWEAALPEGVYDFRVGARLQGAEDSVVVWRQGVKVSPASSEFVWRLPAAGSSVLSLRAPTGKERLVAGLQVEVRDRHGNAYRTALDEKGRAVLPIPRSELLSARVVVPTMLAFREAWLRSCSWKPGVEDSRIVVR